MSVKIERTTGYLLKVAVLALLAIIGFDLFLHAGILAPLYSKPGSFLLSAEESFRRIPFGYLSFAILTVFFTWLAYRLNIVGWIRGLVFGLVFGAVVWGSFTLGLYSISTASPGLLVGWFLGQTVELGIAGVVVGVGLTTNRLRSLVIAVILFFAVIVALAILLQNLGNFD